MITLYQLPVSHFCEKIRWTLAFKRLPYKYKNLLPGLHARTAKKLSGSSSLPIIRDGKNVVSGSSDIITYLDAEYPRFLLTPSDAVQRDEALGIEAYCDASLGPAVRILAYSTLLPYGTIVKPFFTQGGPWYKQIYINRSYPKIVEFMTAKLPIDEPSVTFSHAVLEEVYQKFQPKFEQAEGAFLVGDQFSRADLTMAALLAPLFLPEKYGLPLPPSLPNEFQALSARYEKFRPWLESMYKYRV